MNRPVRSHRARFWEGILAQRFDATTFLIVYAALLLLIPAPLVVRPLGAGGTPAAMWGMFGLLWWLCFRAGGLIPHRVTSPVLLGASAFIVCVLASYAWSMTTGWHVPVNIHQATDDVYDLVPATPPELRAKMIKGADRGLMSLAAWSGVILMCHVGLRRWSDIRRFLSWLVWLTAVVALIGLVQFFTGFQIAKLIHVPGLVANSEYGSVLQRSVLRRVYATASHPIEFGVVLAAIFPLALHRALLSARRLWPWLPPAAIGTAAMMSVSRSAVLVLGIALVIMFLGWPPSWRSKALFIFPMAAVTLRILIPGLLGTILSMWTNLFADPSTTGRTADYGIVFRVAADNLWLGRGQFTFIPRYYRTLDNQFLLSLLELGLIGLVSLVALFATAYFSARGIRRRAAVYEHEHFGLALSAALAGLFIAYATFDALGFPMAAGTGFLLVGVAGAAWQVVRTEELDRVTEGRDDSVADGRLSGGRADETLGAAPTPIGEFV